MHKENLLLGKNSAGSQKRFLSAVRKPTKGNIEESLNNSLFNDKWLDVWIALFKQFVQILPNRMLTVPFNCSIVLFRKDNCNCVKLPGFSSKNVT